MRSKNLLLVIVLLFSVQQLSAQMGYPLFTHRTYWYYPHAGRDAASRFFQRYYIGGGLCHSSIDVRQHYYDADNTKIVHKTVGSALASISVTQGFYFPFVKAGYNSSFGFDVATTMNMYSYSVGTINYSATTSITETATSTHLLAPLSFAFHSGGDAGIARGYNRLNAGRKGLLGFGIGVAPSFVSTKYITSSTQFAVPYFAMFELGKLTGIAWKIRTSFYIANTPLISSTDSKVAQAATFTGNPLGDITTEVRSKTALQVTLSLIPFSPKWYKGKYY